MKTMSKAASDSFAETIVLHSDNGTELSFRGRLFSESAYYDEETGFLTRLRLFAREDGAHVYSIVSGSGAEKYRRHYVISREGDVCRMNDGKQLLVAPTAMLLNAVFGLCGIDPARSEELRPVLEQSLLAAGS
jgi:hypothetical protein